MHTTSRCALLILCIVITFLAQGKDDYQAPKSLLKKIITCVKPYAKITFGLFLVRSEWHTWQYTVAWPYRRLVREFDDGTKESEDGPTLSNKVFASISLAEAAFLVGDGLHDLGQQLRGSRAALA